MGQSPSQFHQLVLVKALWNRQDMRWNRLVFRQAGWRGPYIKDGVVSLIVGDAEEYDPGRCSYTE